MMVTWALSIVLCCMLHSALSAGKPHVTCRRTYRKIGCVHVKETVMTDLLVNDRDKSSKMHQGHLINWKEFDWSIHSLACRCSKKAAEGGYTYFGIRFFGECYGTKEKIDIIDMARSTSKDCVGPKFKQCVRTHTHECVGRQSSEYVYKVSEDVSKNVPTVNGGYSKWSEYGDCSVTCGEGEKTRERVCNNPAPQGSGRDCSALGPSTEVKKCHPMPCKPLELLSRGKVATMSSRYTRSYPAYAKNAVDGNTHTHWNSRSCVHTNQDLDPWWQVDLYYRAAVSRVIVYNRFDCCSERLDGMTITVGDDPTGAHSDVCGHVQYMRGVRVKTVVCSEPLFGRYVRVGIKGRRYLNLCEVEVMGNYVEFNLARGRHASQSSRYLHSYLALAQNAVDGKTSGHWGHRSCSCTNKDAHPWWRVDLAHQAKIYRVIVYNRVDCCSNRLDHFKVTVGDGRYHKRVCGEAGSMNRKPVEDMVCSEPLTGRFVEITLPGPQYLTLCEVQVVGHWAD